MSVGLPELTALGPALLGVLGLCVCLLVEALSGGVDTTRRILPVAAGVLTVGLGLDLMQLGSPPVEAFVGPLAPSLVADDLARIASALTAATALFTLAISVPYARNAGMAAGEYAALLLTAVVGIQTMVLAADLMTAFLGLETLSVVVYALTGMRASDRRASEAALKYFLNGAFATGFVLFGIALLYGATGRLDYAGIAAALFEDGPGIQAGYAGVGAALLLIGLGFKISAAPFHAWVPDVYEGAATPVTGFMAVAVKAAAALVLVRFSVAAAGQTQLEAWVPLLRVLAVASLVVGNALALAQTNIKRLLAYSSIAHVGYALLGVIAVARGAHEAAGAVLVYLVTYAFATLAAFGVVTFFERAGTGVEAERLGAYAGLGFEHPLVGLVLTVAMLGLAGLPPTGGFVGKLGVFSAALSVGELPLVLVAVGGSIAGAVYYLRVVVAFFMREHLEAGPRPSPSTSIPGRVALAMSAALLLATGLFPGALLEHSATAAATLAPR